ncbi:2OG-Fe(II) oxygenase [Streptomyces subrutilus]|uniref:2OG-Fe(II) oxygenase n=1 Tax=Streptomyces subrutilus TaxID=36818 RepID=A0A5P2UQ15_9ACTN|nr:2OG-Fe(II) oxygenase [Streptomyces subrutilus]QEU78787.1 2OG-Fe(II) oxygenase [Streptomyces subrutilus]WSJ32027.1 2OG-Fe(II) oxygenase [Streptomyces subrutilus]GGZ57690.1 hypothetical protein GCM10010371_16400 [Streptomyces subrutilus]
MLRHDAHFVQTDDLIAAHIAEGILRDSDVRELDATYPALDSFEKVVVSNRVKRFQLSIQWLSRDGKPLDAAGRLSAVWARLLDELDSERFIARLGAVVDRDLSTLPRDIGLFTHAKGEYISMHHDEPEKALTVVLYFNQDWPADGGGHFEVRVSHNPSTAPVQSLPPDAGTMIAFDSSVWHATSTVTTGRTLRAAVLEFWRERPAKTALNPSGEG